TQLIIQLGARCGYSSLKASERPISADRILILGRWIFVLGAAHGDDLPSQCLQLIEYGSRTGVVDVPVVLHVAEDGPNCFHDILVRLATLQSRLSVADLDGVVVGVDGVDHD
ncbi:hypothetical protein PFISCL1PPCAC_7833, partial [Pristionchus fissidentatus]